MVQYADPSTVAMKAEQWTGGQVHCRLFRHSWSEAPLILLEQNGNYLDVKQVCPARCGVERKCTVYSDGVEVYQNSAWVMDYSNAENYLMQDDKRQSLGRIGPDSTGILWGRAMSNVVGRKRR